MPHDKNGNLVKEGDVVSIEFKVKSITPTEDFCNLSLESVIPMKPEGTPSTLSLNAGQCSLVTEEVKGPTLADLMGKFEELQSSIEDFINFTPPAQPSAPPPVGPKPPNAGSSPASFKQHGNPAKSTYKPILRTDPPAPKKP